MTRGRKRKEGGSVNMSRKRVRVYAPRPDYNEEDAGTHADLAYLGNTEFTADEIRNMSRASGLAKIYAAGVPGGAAVLSAAERDIGKSLLYLIGCWCKCRYASSARACQESYAFAKEGSRWSIWKPVSSTPWTGRVFCRRLGQH